MDWEQKRGEFFANNPLAFDESTGQVLAGGRPAFEAMQEAGVFTPPSAQYEQAPIEYFVGRFDSFMDMQADNIRGHSSAPVAKIRENIKYLLEQSGDQYDEGDLEELVRYYSMKYGVKVPSESGGQGAGTGYNATITYDPVRPGPYLSAMGGIDGWSQEDFKNGKVESVVFTPDSKDRKPKAHKVSFKDENGRMNSVFFEPERIFKTPNGYMVYGHQTLKDPVEAALRDYATRTYILDEDNMLQFQKTFMPRDAEGNPVSVDSYFQQQGDVQPIQPQQPQASTQNPVKPTAQTVTQAPPPTQAQKDYSSMSMNDLISEMMNFEKTRGSASGSGLTPHAQNPKLPVDATWDDAVKWIETNVVPEVDKIMPGESDVLKAEAVDFVYNAGFDTYNMKITKDPRRYMIQEYYREASPGKLEDGKWSRRLVASDSEIDEMYKSIFSGMTEQEKRRYMSLAKDWYYRNINKKADGSPSDSYEATWKHRVGLFGGSVEQEGEFNNL